MILKFSERVHLKYKIQATDSSATLLQPEDLKSATLLKILLFRETFVLFCSFSNFVNYSFRSTNVLFNIPDRPKYNSGHDDLMWISGFQNGFEKFAVDL